MTHPITPPPELVGQWQDESSETQIADHVQYLVTRAELLAIAGELKAIDKEDDFAIGVELEADQ